MTGIFKSIPIADIRVTDRLRAVNEDHASVLAKSIDEHGLINPITLRRASAAKNGKYTLIAGAHRLRAVQTLGRDEIEAMIVIADSKEARLLEIHENYSRNDLTVLERARFAGVLRDIWEEARGKPINSKGGRNKKEDNMSPFFEPNISEFVAKRLGIHPRSARRLQRITTQLSPALWVALEGTSSADNLSALTKCAKLNRDKQLDLAAAFQAEGGDLKKAFKHVYPEGGRKDEKTRLKENWEDAWGRLSEDDRQDLMERHGLMRKPASEIPDHLRIDVRPAEGHFSALAALAANPKALQRPYRPYQFDMEEMHEMQIANALKAATTVSEDKPEPPKPAVKKRKGKKRGPKPKTLDDRIREWFRPELAELLIARKLSADDPMIKYCLKLDFDEQWEAACCLGNDHDFSDLQWRIEKFREARAA